MEQIKAYSQSKAVWAGIFGVIVSLGSAAGLVFAPEFIDQAAMLAVAVSTLVTSLGGIYGRIKATAKLVSKKEAKATKEA